MRASFLIISLLWVGCQPISNKIKPTDKYFDLPGFTKALIESQVGAKNQITKITNVNRSEEKSSMDTTDSLFWATELFPLLSAELNKPSLFDAYRIQQNIPDTSSNLIKTVYSALPKSNAIIKKIEIKYLGTISEVRQIIALIDNKNLVYNTHQKIHLWTNKYGNKLRVDSLVTEGFNKTILMDSMKYYSKVVVVY